jgi:circadian clock protein KaiC
MTLRKIIKNLTPTGIPGLDDIFMGGIRTGNIVLVDGDSGTGKTTLGMEFIYRGATEFKENGLIISFESSAERYLADAKGFGWDFKALNKKKGMVKIIHSNPSVMLQELLTPEGQLIKEIRAINAKRVLIDGLTPLKMFAEQFNGRSFRDSLYSIIEQLHKLGVTAMLTREVHEHMAENPNQPDEQFVCDTIIKLSNLSEKRNSNRYIEIKKSRGQDYIQGQHTLRFESGSGIKVYRRTQSRPKEFNLQTTSFTRISTGIKTLDPVIGGGIYEGSVTLVVGISGTGKSVMGLQFLGDGAKKGSKGLMISLDEQPKQILRNAKTLGLGIEDMIKEGKILLHCESPLELEMDIHFERILNLIEDNNIERIVIDSVSAYKNTDNEQAQEFIYALATYLKNRLITSFLSYESPELLGLSQISADLKASAIVDNIILLNYVEISTQMRRAITVPKARGTNIPQRTREFVIEKGGVRLKDEKHSEKFEDVPQLPFSSYYGILSRAPARHSPMIDSKVANGEEIPETKFSKT